MTPCRSNDTAILLVGDAYLTAYRGRFHITSLGYRDLRRGRYEPRAFCSDGQIRRVVDFADRRLCAPWISILLLNPHWMAVPVLSEPIETYDFDDLKKQAVRLVAHDFQTNYARKYVKQRILAACSLEALVDVVLTTTEGIHEWIKAGRPPIEPH